MFRWLTFSALLVIPFSPVSAGPWDELLLDAQMLEELIEQDARRLQRQEVQQSLEEADELFPVQSTGSGALRGAAGEESPYVTIRVQGLPLALRDVPRTAWFAPYVQDAAERQLITGYKDAQGRPTGEFGPQDPVTVQQLAKLAVEAADIDLLACRNDLLNQAAEGQWSEQYIRCAEKEGWAVYSDGSVDIRRPATRAEVVVTVLQAFGARIAPRSGTMFDDVDTSTEFAAAIETAAGDNIVSGYSDEEGNSTGAFGPQDPVTRAQTAKVFSLAFEEYEKDEAG